MEELLLRYKCDTPQNQNPASTGNVESENEKLPFENRPSNGTEFNINKEYLINSNQKISDKKGIPIANANNGTKGKSHYKNS